MTDTHDVTAVLVDARDTLRVLELAEAVIAVTRQNGMRDENPERQEAIEATVIRVWGTIYGQAAEATEAAWEAMEATSGEGWLGSERVAEIRDGVHDLLVLASGTAREFANLVVTSPIAKTAATVGEMVDALPEPDRTRALGLQETLYPDGKVSPAFTEMLRRDSRP